MLKKVLFLYLIKNQYVSNTKNTENFNVKFALRNLANVIY